MQTKSNSSSAVASGLVEILGRLRPEEKKQFLKIFDWNAFRGAGKETKRSNGRKHGDPKLYVQGSSGELNFEIPEDKLEDFVSFLSDVLSYDQVNVFIRKGETSEEHSYSKEEFHNFLSSSGRMLAEDYLMLEFGGNTLISGGYGCMDLELDMKNVRLLKEIAERFLRMCGYEYKISKDEFCAIVWDDEIEVHE